MSRRTIPWLAAAAAALAIAGVRAQALTDPMRPPGAQAGLPGSSPEAQADAASGTQLQSVLISRGRKLAVINGVTVPLGGMVGEAKLVKISETEVTLKKGDETEIHNRVTEALRQHFLPEFLNRIDEVIVFHPLGREELHQIVALQLGRLKKQLEENKFGLEVTDAAQDLLTQEGYDPVYGARPLKRVIQRVIEDPVSEGVLSGEFKPGSTVIADLVDGQVKLQVEESSNGSDEGGVPEPEPELTPA